MHPPTVGMGFEKLDVRTCFRCQVTAGIGVLVTVVPAAVVEIACQAAVLECVAI